MKRLKVAVVSDALYPWHKGGKEVRYRHLLSQLPDHQMDVVVYSMKWWEKTPPIVYTKNGSLMYRALCPRVSMYRGARRSIFQAVLFAVATLQLLARDFDVIEADHMPYLQLLPLRIIAWLKRAPLVITWHEVWGKEGWREYVGRAGSLAALIEHGFIQLPNAIIAASPGTAEKLFSMGANRRRVFVAPNALELERLSGAVAPPAAPELLFVGRLIEHKHADVAIEATRILAERGLNVHLGIVGVGPEETRLQHQVVESSLSDRVTFYLSLSSQDDVWSLIRGSRVLMAPSVREGFGMVVAEALALGTPVICADHPDNESSKLIGPNTGSLVEPFDALALAEAAEYWLRDTSTREDRTSAFLEQNSELTVEAMVDSYVRVLRMVT
ncbi:MAG TPA: glycosyltransferase family 4 protein [Acidimicrobiales bacterium]|jgi:glycosyltransferase involved in cell wall biosynthesis|nr:glycosyltransferase family 4 protein [Acidimicrobiales bacterium]